MNSFKKNKKLTTTEIQILKDIKNGLSSAQIAKNRNCSSRTIEKHRSNIIFKLKLPSTQNALLIWLYKNPKIFNT